MLYENFIIKNQTVRQEQSLLTINGRRKYSFCKISCSEDYQSLQMTDYQSIHKMAFKFAGGIFAFKRPNQGYSRRLAAIFSIRAGYLDVVIQTDPCAQYVGDNGTEIITQQLCENNRVVFRCIREARPRVSTSECQFAANIARLRRKYSYTQKIQPRSTKDKDSLTRKNSRQNKQKFFTIYWVSEFLPQSLNKVV